MQTNAINLQFQRVKRDEECHKLFHLLHSFFCFQDERQHTLEIKMLAWYQEVYCQPCKLPGLLITNYSFSTQPFSQGHCGKQNWEEEVL